MARSIMHRKEDRTCYLCMKLHDDYSRKITLQEHHVIGGPYRKLSERYGLKVYLCFQHHTYDGGPEAVHRNTEINRELKKDAQRAFEKTYPNLVFMQIFGKNMLDESDRQQSCGEETMRQQGIPEGFIPLEKMEDKKDE